MAKSPLSQIPGLKRRTRKLYQYTGKAENGMSISQILSNAQYEPDTVNARLVRVRTAKIRRLNDGRALCDLTTATQYPNNRRHIHRQMVWSRDVGDTSPLSLCHHIMVTCDCNRFQYVWEYALTENGASKVIHGDGSPPDETNPQHLAAPCKHLLRVLWIIKTKGW